MAENTSEIIEFQSEFCFEIQQLIDGEENFNNMNDVEDFQVNTCKVTLSVVESVYARHEILRHIVFFTISLRRKTI